MTTGLGPERCSTRSLALGESMTGTASTVANWIMLEHPGPWGRDALATSRFPDDVRRRLRELAATLGVRIVLIRRYGRHAAAQGIDCYFARTGPEKPWLEHARLESAASLFELDLSPLRRGERPGGSEAEGDPLFLACTHGRRDPCCSEKGRPLARALARDFGDRAWETSHIGGDRFAGNLVCFPHGMYFGRLGPEAGVIAAETYRDGRIDLSHYRGRSCFGFAVHRASPPSHVRARPRGASRSLPSVANAFGGLSSRRRSSPGTRALPSLQAPTPARWRSRPRRPG